MNDDYNMDRAPSRSFRLDSFRPHGLCGDDGRHANCSLCRCLPQPHQERRKQQQQQQQVIQKKNNSPGTSNSRIVDQVCQLAFDGQNLQEFLIGRQICVTICMFIVARMTTVSAAFSMDPVVKDDGVIIRHDN
jgi:hypothetical protein